MIPVDLPKVDSRDSGQVLEEFQDRRRGYVPAWDPQERTAGAALGQIFSRLVSVVLQRLNQAPLKSKLALLDLLGHRLIPAQSARVPVVFQLGQGASDSSAPAGTQVAAPPPPGCSQQLVFETEQEIGVAAGKLVAVVSLWPGRDEYVNHSADYKAGKAITFFQRLKLQQTPHILYLAHNSLLAISGVSHLEVEFNLAQGSSSPLEIAWEYWDGKIWRGFKSYKPSCLEAAEKGHDGTNGLMTDGSIRLDTDCAETALTAVNGTSSYWIRGRLTEPLPPNPAELLPVAETVRLRTLIDQGLTFNASVVYGPPRDSDQRQTTLIALDEGGQPLGNVTVTVTSLDSTGTNRVGITLSTRSDPGDPFFGQFDLVDNLETGTNYQFDVTIGTLTGSTQARFKRTTGPSEIRLTIKVLKGLLPDKAVSNGKPVDVSKAFYPFGQAPTPGFAFYFKQEEIFTKPGARVQIYLDAVPFVLINPVSNSNPDGDAFLPHLVNWEYWNGREWTLLLQSEGGSAPTRDFTVGEIIEFTVPNDMVSTKVNNEDGLWIRVRLVNGGYGVSKKITITGGTPASISYIQPQPPLASAFRLGYTWTKGPEPLEHVFTCNDFQYEDHTDDARWPGRTFSPYKPVGEITPALYLGFNQKLPVNNFGIYLDIVEQNGQGVNPALVWEYWNGRVWREVVADDDTERLRLPGIVSLIPADDSQRLARFDELLHWLRGRLKENGPPNETSVLSISTNAVWASQWRTFTNVPLGASTGTPKQVFQFNQVPVLAGEIIEVQELSGPRADSEWRNLAMEVDAGDPGVVKELEAQLAAEGPQTDIVRRGVRLTRDKLRRVTAVWMQWEERNNLFRSNPGDRHYVLDHASGRVFFGDGLSGRIPPAGAAIQGSKFRTGGGTAGNVPKGTITQLLGSVSGIQGLTNPRAAEGGADGETIRAFSTRASLTLRNRGRAISPLDYETMAREASAGVAIARALPAYDPVGIEIPGSVAVLIIPQSLEPRPLPSFGLREEVRKYLEKHAAGDIAAAHRIEVIGPAYLPVDVSATLAPRDPSAAGAVEREARKALENFLHPLHGGPNGLGWDLGRGVFLSDVAAVLGQVSGVDFVEELALSASGILQGTHVDVPRGQIVVAGEIRLNLVVPSAG